MALATATEVGDSSDLSMVTVTQGRHLILSYFPEFVAKTAPGFNPFSRAIHLRSFASLWARRMWNVSLASVVVSCSLRLMFPLLCLGLFCLCAGPQQANV